MSKTPAITPESESKTRSPEIWWSNSVFFVTAHIAAVVGVFYRPIHVVPKRTLALTVVLWQLASFGVTIGYHRLWSHRAFRASLGVRIVLAVLGSSAFQGSIKWWCLRHRLHHRFTDDPVHDPYSATRGLLFSHMGWIFFKPSYDRMALVDREDLDNDPVVVWQHKYFVPLALSLGFVVPTLLGSMWRDTLGGLIWGGLVSRLLIWHCTFLVNSLAHWDGLQPYTDENTSKGNFILALLTAGEGNHNFHHAFPHDFRSGPSIFDWDPSKWAILALYRLGIVSSLRKARDVDVIDARAYMDHKSHHKPYAKAASQEEWAGEIWQQDSARKYVLEKAGRCVLLIDGFLVDVTSYLAEHPGGSGLLRNYSIRAPQNGEESVKWRDSSWAFDGGLNNHSRAAKRRMQELRVAKLSLPETTRL